MLTLLLVFGLVCKEERTGFEHDARARRRMKLKFRSFDEGDRERERKSSNGHAHRESHFETHCQMRTRERA